MDTKKIKLKATGSNRPVVYVGNFNPPITGQKFVNQKLADLLERHGISLKYFTSLPVRGKDQHYYKIAQVCRIISLPVQLLVARARGSRHFLYSLLGGRSRVIDMTNVSVARLLGYQVMLYHHSSQFAKSKSRMMKAILTVSGRETTQIMASPKMGRDMIETYGIDVPIIFVDNSAYVDEPLPAPPGDRLRFRLGLLSNLNKSKGLDASIDTLEVLVDMGCDCELILAGPAVDKEAIERLEMAKQKFQGRIQTLGPVSGAQKEKFFRDIDVFLFPSTHKHETQSLVVSEAQAYGCPVIVYDHGYVAENIPGALPQCIIPANRSFKDEAAQVVGDWISNKDLLSAARNITLDHFEQRHQQASKSIEALCETLQG